MEAIISFEKWKDPFELDEIDIDGGETEYDEDEVDFDDHMEHGPMEQPKPNKPVRCLMTPSGPMPVPDAGLTTEWNLWMAHTNFRFTEDIVELIENVDGVEAIDICTPYRMRIGFAKLFRANVVMGDITTKVKTYLGSV